MEFPTNLGGDDGKFWETWYLSGVWAAKGDLKGVVERRKLEGDKDQDRAVEKRKETNGVISFLCRKVSFGQLDVVVQRAAMVID